MLMRLVLGSSRAAEIDLNDPYSMHQTLARCFPCAIQFRIEHNSIVMRASTLPLYERFPTNYIERLECYQDHIMCGDYRFRLRVSPIVRHSHARERGLPTMRVVEKGQEMEWLRQRMGGCELLETDISPMKWMSGKQARQPVIDVQGRLRVTDPDTVRETLQRGIGRNKYLGCGLLLLDC